VAGKKKTRDAGSRTPCRGHAVASPTNFDGHAFELWRIERISRYGLVERLVDRSGQLFFCAYEVEYVNDRMVQRVTNFEGIAKMQVSFLDVRFAAQVAEYKREPVGSNVSNALRSLEMIETAISRLE
jgi:hypothetical protein